MNAVALHPNQAELISGDQNGKVKVWDLTASKCHAIEMGVPAGDEDCPIQSIR